MYWGASAWKRKAPLTTVPPSGTVTQADCCSGLRANQPVQGNGAARTGRTPKPTIRTRTASAKRLDMKGPLGSRRCGRSDGGRPCERAYTDFRRPDNASLPSQHTARPADRHAVAVRHDAVE